VLNCRCCHLANRQGLLPVAWRWASIVVCLLYTISKTSRRLSQRGYRPGLPLKDPREPVCHRWTANRSEPKPFPPSRALPTSVSEGFQVRTDNSTWGRRRSNYSYVIHLIIPAVYSFYVRFELF
jgi:hypothetical protein